MIEYNPISDELKVLNNRGQMVKVGAKSKKLIPSLVKYVCTELALGKSLSSILPEKSKLFPPIVDFINILQSDEYKSEYGIAENTRAKILSEKFIGAIQKYDQDPSKGSEEFIKAMHTAIKLMDKAGHTQQNIQVVFNTNFPEDMWK